MRNFAAWNTSRVGFTGLSWSGGDTDAIVIATPGQLYGNSGPYASYWVPASLHIAMVDEVTLVANEHIGIQILNLADVVVTGTASAYSSSGWNNFGPGLTDIGVIDVMCGTLTTQTGGEEVVHEDGWNLQIPYRKVWTPDERQRAYQLYDDAAGYESALVIRLYDPPSATVQVSASFVFQNITVVSN